ncbi:hypothetical protein DEO72_LG6g1285 [Vigna unguiculata]|uniref:Uncharacterized protein n=1 Tax=Vigna unguiculata TaxID=3917 RepID=A0A4D6M5D3_VIGUN|nr:hypothetical protein DEO72_LG6g1285 [Vigna unguiculata]
METSQGQQRCDGSGNDVATTMGWKTSQQRRSRNGSGTVAAMAAHWQHNLSNSVNNPRSRDTVEAIVGTWWQR